jgi:hypothetical protein
VVAEAAGATVVVVVGAGAAVVVVVLGAAVVVVVGLLERAAVVAVVAAAVVVVVGPVRLIRLTCRSASDAPGADGVDMRRPRAAVVTIVSVSTSAQRRHFEW